MTVVKEQDALLTDAAEFFVRGKYQVSVVMHEAAWNSTCVTLNCKFMLMASVPWSGEQHLYQKFDDSCQSKISSTHFISSCEWRAQEGSSSLPLT